MQATKAKSVATMVIEYYEGGEDGSKCAVDDAFAAELTTDLQACYSGLDLSKKPSREKLWGAYYLACSSPTFTTRWSQFVKQTTGEPSSRMFDLRD